MKQRTMLAALLLGAFAAVSCLVYGPEDLPGSGGNGQNGGAAGRGGDAPNAGGSGGGGGTYAGRGGTAGAAGAAGTPSTAGAGTSGSPGHGGAPGMGGTGAEGGTDDGGAPPGGTTSGGTAGATSGTGGTVGPPKTLIEDMEDGNRAIRGVRDEKGISRNGFWYVYVNGTREKLEPPEGAISMTPHPSAVPGPAGIVSTKGFRLLVSGVPNDVGNGAAAAFNIVQPRGPYDASGYMGISYYLRASRPITIRVQIVTKGTDEDSGICDADNEKCSDHFYKEEMVGTAWNLHRGLWAEPSEFAQEGWGSPVEFDPSQVVAIQFFVLAHDTTPEIELWIDDVSFVEPER